MRVGSGAVAAVLGDVNPVGGESAEECKDPWDIVSIDVYSVGMDSFRKNSANPDLPFQKIVVFCDQFGRGVLTRH